MRKRRAVECVQKKMKVLHITDTLNIRVIGNEA